MSVYMMMVARTKSHGSYELRCASLATTLYTLISTAQEVSLQLSNYDRKPGPYETGLLVGPQENVTRLSLALFQEAVNVCFFTCCWDPGIVVW